MYKKKSYICGDYIVVQKYHPGPHGKGRRGRREKPSTEAMIRYNQQRRIAGLQRLILANFGECDFHLTLSYRKELRPASMEEAKKRIADFCRKMRTAYRKAGKEWKAIWITERGKQGACHHHLIVEKTDMLMDLIRKCWPWGHEDYKPMYEDGAFRKLAEYFCKKETKEEAEGCTYSRTRNLIIPEAKTEIIHAERWTEEPKKKKNFEILKDSIVNAENPITGWPYQSYILHRIAGSGKKKRGSK